MVLFHDCRTDGAALFDFELACAVDERCLKLPLKINIHIQTAGDSKLESDWPQTSCSGQWEEAATTKKTGYPGALLAFLQYCMGRFSQHRAFG